MSTQFLELEYDKNTTVWAEYDHEDDSTTYPYQDQVKTKHDRVWFVKKVWVKQKFMWFECVDVTGSCNEEQISDIKEWALDKFLERLTA